jgi:hypothetical protein
MSIKDRDLKPGTTLVARYKGQEHSAEVVKTEDGIRYRLGDGREFKSPSSAGSAVMGGNACNGWRFWSLVGEEHPTAPKKAAAKKGKAKQVFERLEDGRYFCNACMEPFTAPNGVEPIGCPQGHQPTEAAAS